MTTVKTYLYQEVYGHKEITEWVPADVARELLEALRDMVSDRDDLSDATVHFAKCAIKKACEQ